MGRGLITTLVEEARGIFLGWIGESPKRGKVEEAAVEDEEGVDWTQQLRKIGGLIGG